MRTTLAIDDDVLAAARELSKIENKSLGDVISGLARAALHPTTTRHRTRMICPCFLFVPACHG